MGLFGKEPMGPAKPLCCDDTGHDHDAGTQGHGSRRSSAWEREEKRQGRAELRSEVRKAWGGGGK